jgi:hypothetical protein
VSLKRALYFPVKPEPLRMQPGLFRFGTDFGNGADDQRYFPRDDTSARYLSEKARVLAAFPGRNARVPSTPEHERCLEAATRWFVQALAQEGLEAAARTPLERLGEELVEDFVVLQRDDAGADRAVCVNACFPSGWRPEQLLGQSFAQIHGAIPGITSLLSKSRSLVDAMVERGPYVRFVWTISADDELDHHPEQGRRAAWSPGTARGYLRVERQTTVPLPEVDASIFLIRTYLYGFDELPPAERATLATALLQMPAEILRYKRLQAALPRALELLA